MSAPLASFSALASAAAPSARVSAAIDAAMIFVCMSHMSRGTRAVFHRSREDPSSAGWSWPARSPMLGPMTIRRTMSAALAAALLTPAAAAAEGQLLLVHGYGSASSGKDCNGSTWRNALRYYQRAGGRARASMTTVGYYRGDRGRCDAMIGDGRATNARPIQDIARDLATYIASTGRPVDVIAHSMGGLIVRAALLGSAQGWSGFPARLAVDNVVTLGT